MSEINGIINPIKEISGAVEVIYPTSDIVTSLQEEIAELNAQKAELNNLFCSIIARTATEITIPEDVTRIGNYVFYNYVTLKTVNIPDSVTRLEAGAFRSCTNLVIDEIPENVTFMGLYTFGGCTKITEITFLGTPTDLNAQVFNGCPNLLTINVPWAEGEVINAPWGATNATINYNYTGD